MRDHLSKIVNRHGYLILSVVLSIAATLSVSTASLDGVDETQKASIKFSHKFHVKDSGISCTDCHSATPTSKLASDNLTATHKNCQTCHEEQVEKTCTYCHSSEDVSTYVFDKPVRELKFSHEFHIAEQKI
ncbi:MAG: cytochrome c3 family protein, partial [Ignavibacteriales bacterium]|nr:cytochrome c3 family protein [Ignavibacteriales bacterium]